MSNSTTDPVLDHFSKWPAQTLRSMATTIERMYGAKWMNIQPESLTDEKKRQELLAALSIRDLISTMRNTATNSENDKKND